MDLAPCPPHPATFRLKLSSFRKNNREPTESRLSTLDKAVGDLITNASTSSSAGRNHEAAAAGTSCRIIAPGVVSLQSEWITDLGASETPYTTRYSVPQNSKMLAGSRGVVEGLDDHRRKARSQDKKSMPHAIATATAVAWADVLESWVLASPQFATRNEVFTLETIDAARTEHPRGGTGPGRSWTSRNIDMVTTHSVLEFPNQFFVVRDSRDSVKV